MNPLNTITAIADISAQGYPLSETLFKIAAALPGLVSHSEEASARIAFAGVSYESPAFDETPYALRCDFSTVDDLKGHVCLCYRHPAVGANPPEFSEQERELLGVAARLVAGHINLYRGRDQRQRPVEKGITVGEDFRKVLTTDKKPLQLFFNRQILDKYVYLDMMKFKVHNILFVATLYDAFTLETDDGFFEQFMGEIYQYSLFSLPRITGVSSPEEALELLRTTHFDMALLMVGLDADASFALSAQIKDAQPDIPIYLLANQKNAVKEVERRALLTPSVDKTYVWEGNSDIIFSIVKSAEDEVNVVNDTELGLVRVILLVEDSPEHYSKLLSLLFSIVFSQVQKLLQEDDRNEINRVSKMRQRPKILHARNYEDAMYYIERYRDFLLCVISDVEFDRNGARDPQAGLKLLTMLRQEMPQLPTIMQSTDPANATEAKHLGVTFINKESESVRRELVNFLTSRLGFGDFVFRNPQGKPLALAKGLREFETIFRNVPTERLQQHCRDHRISSWLMSRGEIPLARTVSGINFFDYDDPEEYRGEMLHVMDSYRDERRRGKRLDYDEIDVPDERNVIMLSSGALGGKGRGLAFINTLIQNLDTREFDGRLNIRIPITAIVGTDEFTEFIKRGHLVKYVLSEPDYGELRERFDSVPLSDRLRTRLRRFVAQVHQPLAVRSSSLSEDSMNQPFAGVFDTYLVPNNADTVEDNAADVERAIKMVFASIYSPQSRAYFKSTQLKIEKEKMSVIVEVLAGGRHDDYYYPHVSGTAQSYNYYPVAHMQPEEGFAVAGFGLGYYVVGGSMAYRFSPAWPDVETMSVADMVKNTQVEFLAVDLQRRALDYVHQGEKAPLATLDMMEAERAGTLKHCASVYDVDNDRLTPGLRKAGPRVVNFADILRHDYVPLPRVLSVVLAAAKDAFGTPVEIEWAVDLDPDEQGVPSFYLLQMKPIITDLRGDTVEIERPAPGGALLYTEQSLGNGRVSGVSDIIFCDPATFDKLRTEQMAREIGYLNEKMRSEGRQYVLIGPGRWGTRDRFIGIPVAWSEISQARLIVELSLPGFPLDSSLGSHFFHNVTSMGIGYASVQSDSSTDFVDWPLVRGLEEVEATEFFRHVRAPQPLDIRMNGRKRKAIVRGTDISR